MYKGCVIVFDKTHETSNTPLSYFQCYKRILQLDPVNIQGLHNLCVVYVERGRLLQAQACLEHAHRLAPEEDYVLRHLQIIQNRITKTKLTPNTEEHEAFHHIDFSEFSDNKNNKKYEEDKNIASSVLQSRNQPLKTETLKEERYSSRVVETETVYVDDIDNVDADIIDRVDSDSKSFYGHGRYQLTGNGVGTDLDDPSSGMS